MPDEERERSTETNSPAVAVPERACRSMHENVEIWEDICVCEPEPRWQALAEELEEKEKMTRGHRDAATRGGESNSEDKKKA